MSDRIERIKSQFNFLLPMMSEIHLSELEQIIEQANRNLGEYFLKKLNSNEWPKAADPMAICQQSETDKKSRASAIYHLFVSSRADKGCKFLDYGCGEGHVVDKIRAEGMKFVVGYDIKEQGWDRFEKFDNVVYTSNRELVEQNKPYDAILLYDVLDHVVNKNPVEILKDVKSLLSNEGIILVRFHPWCGRHGTHLWRLNKAYAHLIFTEDELLEMGHVNMPTIKVIRPREEYPEMIRQAGLKIAWENSIHEQAGPFLNDNPPLKDKVLAHYNGRFGYHDIEEVFRDYVLKQ